MRTLHPGHTARKTTTTKLNLVKRPLHGLHEDKNIIYIMTYTYIYYNTVHCPDDLYIHIPQYSTLSR